MTDEGANKRSLQQLRQAWLAVVTSAEAELHKTTERLLSLSGLTGEEGAAGLRAELVARLRKQRDELESRIDEGVRAALARVRAPIDREIASLRARLEALQGRLDRTPRRRSDRDPADRE